MPEFINAVELVDRIARVALAVALAFAIGIVVAVASGSTLPELSATARAMAPIVRF
jgi:ABC-type nitrate/sulfonate/bicarbonate transport system permease component